MYLSDEQSMILPLESETQDTLWVPVLLCLVTQPCPAFAAPWTVAARLLCLCGFSRQDYWCGLPGPPPGDLPNPGLNPGFLYCRRILSCLSHQESRDIKWSHLKQKQGMTVYVRGVMFCFPGAWYLLFFFSFSSALL